MKDRVTRQMIEVMVTRHEQYSGGPFVFEGKIDEVIESLKRICQMIPEDYRDQARCEIDSVSSWGDSHYAQISVSYYRPETWEEAKERSHIERERLADSITKTHEYLQALKAKFEA
jgi:hypothetical protein